MSENVIRLKQLVIIIGLSKATIRRRLKLDPNFPKLIRLGSSNKSAVGFLSTEVQQWLDQRVEERNLDSVKVGK